MSMTEGHPVLGNREEKKECERMSEERERMFLTLLSC